MVHKTNLEELMKDDHKMMVPRINPKIIIQPICRMRAIYIGGTTGLGTVATN